MIWFSCKHCGKTHGRPEAAAGATVFCDCGAGLVVPWESTASEPAALPAELAVPLHLDPLTFEAVPAKPERPLPPPLPKARRKLGLGKRDPRYCLNHEETVKHASCADCGESFCAGCLLAFAGTELCGPCKNYRVKSLQRPIPASNFAIVSVLVAIVASPVALCLLPAGHAVLPWWNLAALVPQALAAGLAVMAIRRTDGDPQIGGQALALTALCTACVSSFLIVLWLLYTPQQWT